MTSRTLQVHIDNRARLMSAVLSATRWPEIEQTRKRHRAHVHARNTAKRALDLAKHPAVETLHTLLDQGIPLEALYTYALSLSWPELTLPNPVPWAPTRWNDQLADFYEEAMLADWWAEENHAWQRAIDETRKIISAADLYGFFRPFVGDVTEQLILMPNISYPSDTEIGVRLNNRLYCIAPPRIAWGDNEPWPFDEDPGHIFRGAVAEFGRLLMVSYLRQHAPVIAPLADTELPVSRKFRESHPTWGDQFTALFVVGAVAIFLEQAVNSKEAQAYVLMENKLHGVTILPGVVSVLQRYLSEYEEGRFQQLADYLPNFARNLRVAKRVVSL
jgi:hypothetical protein